jgi:hypothetical protein
MLGRNDLKQWALPAGWDASRLTQIALQSGETYEALIEDIATGLVLANQQLTQPAWVAGLMAVTETPEVEYRVGVSNGFEVHTEYARPDARRGRTTGHMLPLIPYDRMMGWTWDFLRKARRAQIDADIASGLGDLKDIWEQRLLTRLFRSTFEAVASGRSVPFADGGTADAAYVPPAVPERGGTFLYTHNHYLRLNGITQANLETAAAHLYEHGHDAPYDLLVSYADIGLWTNVANVTGYVMRPDPVIQLGTQTATANVGDGYIGAVNTDYGACRMWASGRVPTKYYALYKTFGRLDRRNPLWVYGSPTYQLQCVLLAGDHIREFPLENAILFFEFGVGVGEDRTAAVLVRNHTDGVYSDPTIS